jgi:maltose O-acetyltransferase
MNLFRELGRKIVYPTKKDSPTFIKYLKKKGAVIGDGVVFYDPTSTFIDTQYPFLISIGKNVNIASRVSLFTHDYSWSVIKGKNGDLFGSSGPVTIGNNVFIGCGSIILRNSQIGNNSIIGAGSIVTGLVPGSQVWGGNPAHYLCSLEQFAEKRKNSQIDEAFNLYCAYVHRFGKEPDESIFFEYISLFVDFKNPENTSKYSSRLSLMGNFDMSLDNINLYKRPFSSFLEMISFFRKKKEQ